MWFGGEFGLCVGEYGREGVAGELVGVGGFGASGGGKYDGDGLICVLSGLVGFNEG